MNKNSERGRLRPWRPQEDDYMREHYATTDSEAIAFFLRRTRQGVWARAKRLGLTKPEPSRFRPGHQIGLSTRFTPGNIPNTKGAKTKLRLWERAVALFDEHRELTQSDIARLLDVPIGSISGSLVQRPAGLMRVDRWQLIGKHYHAIYVAGPGDDAEKPNQQAVRESERIEQERKFAEAIARPEPIPRPIFGPWGIPWTTDYKQAAQAA